MDFSIGLDGTVSYKVSTDVIFFNALKAGHGSINLILRRWREGTCFLFLLFEHRLFVQLWLLYCKTTLESMQGLGKYHNKGSEMGSGSSCGLRRWPGKGG